MKLKALAVTMLVSLLSACSWWEMPNRYGVLPSVWDSMSPDQQQQVISAYHEDNHGAYYYDSDGHPVKVVRPVRSSARSSARTSGPQPTYTITADGRKKWSLPK